MAINILQAPTNIYPAYNDSYLKFSSTLSNQQYAEIKVYPLDTFGTFKIFPIDNTYLFNLKEFVKFALNKDGFEDKGSYDTYGYSYSGLLHSQQIEIAVYSDTTSEAITTTYEFSKSIKQIGEQVHTNTTQILDYSTNGVDYYLDYFEGYPMDFTLQKVITGGITIKNLNNGLTSKTLLATSNNAFRIVVDNGINNWNTDNILPIFDLENRLEIFRDNVFKTNLTLKKHPSKCGVYLKWFNSQGSYSYMLFDEYFKLESKTKDLGFISKNTFQNIGDSSFSGQTNSLGKESELSYKLKTRVNPDQANRLKDLFTSPFVQMYNSFKPFTEAQFIDVNVDSRSYSISNKKYQNEVSLTINLPQQYNISL